MKSILLLVFGLCSPSLYAWDQGTMKLPSDCRQAIVDAATKKVGAEGDETFNVVNVKLVYGGVFKGLSMPVVAIVRTSDEVDPRDLVVKTSRPENGLCSVEYVEVLSDGLTVDDPELDL